MFNPRFWRTKANVAYDETSNLACLEVAVRSSMTKPNPGTYYYVHVLDDVRYAYQSHPFSLAYVRDDTSHGGAHVRSMMRRPHANFEHYTEAEPLLVSTTARQSTSALVLLIRPYDGFTFRLAQKASLGPRSLRVLVEGPYGHTVPLRQYQNVLFVVGGTGIAVALSYLEYLLSNDSAVSSLRIVWAVREHAFLARVLDEFRDCLQDERVGLEAYITQEGQNRDEEAVEGCKRVNIKVGRPDVHAVVGDAASEASHKSLATMACGPAQMADQARSGSVAALASGFNVDYFEESFKW
jgi:NAD(P)H-flavin reductase